MGEFTSLDYEIKGYTVYYQGVDRIYRHKKFSTEEHAVDFIKAHRSAWISYSLIQMRSAIIDF